MPLSPKRDLDVTISHNNETFNAKLPLRVLESEGDYRIVPGVLELPVEAFVHENDTQLHVPDVRKSLAAKVNAALKTIDPAHPSTEKTVALEGVSGDISINFKNLNPDWRKPENYRYTHYEVAGPSMLSGNMPSMKFESGREATAVASYLEDMIVMAHRSKPFNELLQQDLNTESVPAVVFRAMAEQTRQEHGITSDNMDDIWPFMKERIEANPNHRRLASLFPAITPLQHSTIDEAATVMRSNSQLDSLSDMMQMKTVADAMQNSILSAISRDATIPNPLSRLPTVPANESVGLKFDIAAQAGNKWVEGMAVIRGDGSLVGVISPSEENASRVIKADPTFRASAANLIETDARTIDNLLGREPEPEQPDSPKVSR